MSGDREFGLASMITQKYKRTVEQLREKASMFWPSELSQKETELSIIPELLRTQDQFIAIVNVDVSNLEGLFQVANSATLPANMFLKHMVVLADFGGEMLQRINSRFASLFPSGALNYIWKGQQLSYSFKTLPIRGSLSNHKLGLTGRRLLESQPLNDLLKDVIALLMFGNAAIDETVARQLLKCEIGNYLGRPDDLEKFIRQRYIWVSRITSGAQSNNLGQIAQTFVQEYIKDNIGIDDIKVVANGKLPGVTYTENPDQLVSFDAIVSNGVKYAAVEVSFQVTTNSVIERKAGQARYRYDQVKQAGHKITYVIDGAGNFQRENAVRTLCAHSDCTVAFTREELDVLCQFLREYFTNTEFQ